MESGSVKIFLVVLTLLVGGRRVRVTLLHILGMTKITEAVLQSLDLHLLIGEPGQFTGSLDVADFLAVTLGEDNVDLLQTATGGLGVEEVHDGDEDGVPGSEEEVGSPADVGDHDRRDHDDSEVEEPVRAGGDSVGLGTGTDGRDLSGVQPGQGSMAAPKKAM